MMRTVVTPRKPGVATQRSATSVVLPEPHHTGLMSSMERRVLSPMRLRSKWRARQGEQAVRMLNRPVSVEPKL
jgi:hypothetical protein